MIWIRGREVARALIVTLERPAAAPALASCVPDLIHYELMHLEQVFSLTIYPNICSEKLPSSQSDHQAEKVVHAVQAGGFTREGAIVLHYVLCDSWRLETDNSRLKMLFWLLSRWKYRPFNHEIGYLIDIPIR